MAQDFERHIARATGTSGATLYTAGGDDAVVSIRLVNIHSAAIAVDCFVTTGGNDYYLIKGVSIPAASSLELIDGGSRFILESGDALKVDTDTASSLDTWVSVISDIS
jgi:hypothetical protein